MVKEDRFVEKTKKEFYEIVEKEGFIFDNLWRFVEKKMREIYGSSKTPH